MARKRVGWCYSRRRAGCPASLAHKGDLFRFAFVLRFLVSRSASGSCRRSMPRLSGSSNNVVERGYFYAH